MNYTIHTLCNENLFIKDSFPLHSQNRYIKIFQYLFKIGHNLALSMKRGKLIPFNNELSNIRNILFGYVESIYTNGYIHHDLLINSIGNIKKISTDDEKSIEKGVLKSMIMLKKMLDGHFLQFSKESVDYFITRTITIYSLYIALKK